VHRPWDFVATSVRSIPKYAGDWVRGLVNVGDRVGYVPFYLAFLVAVGDRMR
jgi:hypothetical protein